MSGKLITEDGAPVAFKAVYYRYHARYEAEFDTALEAVLFLHAGEDQGEMSFVEVLAPDGSVAVPREQVFDLWGEPHDEIEAALTRWVGAPQIGGAS